MANDPLVEGSIYHVYSKSISDYVIFNSERDYIRMLEALQFYKDPNAKTRNSITSPIRQPRSALVQIIAFCLMSTHIHLILKQLQENGISLYMNKVLNGYTHYFNARVKRKGPLWEGRFKRKLIENEEYLLHLTRYIHLNPVTAYLVNAPEEWKYSSFKEYLGEESGICEFKEFIDIASEKYADFVNSRIDYQRELATIKHLVIEP
ncbi:MAG: transposase [Deltaproteobacteria bacterium]